MITRSQLIAACALAVTLGRVDAAGADTRFQHVSLISARDRVSLVFELTGEPADVATRRVSAAILELDAGPVVAPAQSTSFMAPPGVRFVMGVSIQSESEAGGRLKARITLLERARSAVRVLGRRVYVDFSQDAAPAATTQLERGRPAPAPAKAQTAAPAPAVAQAPVTPPAPSPRTAYREAVQPAVEKFEQLTPFLRSAAASPSEAVFKAVSNTLVNIQGVLLSVDVPVESKTVHDLLSLAVASALTGVSPEFSGDRVTQVRQSLSLLEQAKNSW